MWSERGRVVWWAALLCSLCFGAFVHAQEKSRAAGSFKVLGPLHGWGGWKASERKDRDATGSPQVVAPGLNGSQQAALFTMNGSSARGNTSAQHVFGELRGDRLVVEFTVQPSNDSRNLGVAVRGGGAAAAYLRLGKRRGACEYYDDKNVFREVGPFKAHEASRIRIECDTQKQTSKVWVNGVGGQEYPFHDKTPFVDRIDLFLAYGPGTPETAIVDDIVVRDGAGNIVFADGFERPFASPPTSQPVASDAGPGRAANAVGDSQAATAFKSLGQLHGLGQWRLSDRKGKESPASPTVVAPGLDGSQRAALFSLRGYDDPGDGSAQRGFGPLRGDRVVVELTVQPSSDLRNLAIAVRGGGEAAAYLRLNGRDKGVCEHYDNEDKYREVARFNVNVPNRIRMELNTRKQTIRATINGEGGQEYPFHGRTQFVDRIDLLMTHGSGPAATAVVDNILVRDGEGNVAFAEDFERYLPAKPVESGLPAAAIPKITTDDGGTYTVAEAVCCYRPVEIELRANHAGVNPYAEGPAVTCVFDGVSGEAIGKKIEIAGFWDGQDVWRVRFAPTAAGQWQFVTASTDSGLDGRRGGFTARAATREEVAANPLRRGFLEASKRVFRHSDGSPFLPVGDSQFSFTEEFYDEEWKAWVDVLHERGLNSFLGMVWLGKYTRAGESPFRDFDPASDQLNAEYFQRLDRWVAYANDHGILMGLALGGFPADSQQWWVRFRTREREDRYFKYIVARYAAFNVRWLMYGEVNERNTPWKATWDQEVRHKAELVKAADPYHHPIGSHHTSADLKTIDSPFIDYLDYQDGGHEDEGANLPGRARRWASESRGKPVWSEEFWYSAPFYVKKNKFGDEAGARCLHLNFLSGLAFPTLGSLMRAHSTYEAFPPAEAAKAGTSLEKYLLEHDESLKRFGAFAKFYAGLPLDQWECVQFDPANKRWTARFGAHYVAYLAPGKSVDLDLSVQSGPYRASALMIQTDEVIDLGTFDGGKVVSLMLPNGKSGEAVVKLMRQADK